MHHLKAAGILAIALILVPFMWNGDQDYRDLREAAGPACVVDGDVGRRIAVLEQGDRRMEVGQRSDGRCQLGGGFESGSVWNIHGQNYSQTGTYTAGDPFPAAAWEWPVTLTWDDEGLTTLNATGWQRQMYGAMNSIMPLAVLFTALGMALYVWTEEPLEVA